MNLRKILPCRLFINFARNKIANREKAQNVEFLLGAMNLPKICSADSKSPSVHSITSHESCNPTFPKIGGLFILNFPQSWQTIATALGLYRLVARLIRQDE